MKNFESPEPCAHCGIRGSGRVTYHHIYTRKAYKEFEFKSWNLLPVCLAAHNEIHAKGTSYMAEKYPSIKKWLEENGWQVCPLRGKWSYVNRD